MGGLVGDFGLHQEAVALPRNSLDVERLIGGIAKRLAEFVDSGIYIGVVVHMRIGGPEADSQPFAGDDFPRVFEKWQEKPIKPPLELEPGRAARNLVSL